MATRATSDAAETEASIGQLVAAIKTDLTALVRDEIELAKTEMREDAKSVAQGGAMAAVAGVFALFAFIMGSFALVYGVRALGITLGWSFLIVTGFYLFVTVVLLLAAKGRFGHLSKARRTKVTAQQAAAALRPSNSDRT